MTRYHAITHLWQSQCRNRDTASAEACQRYFTGTLWITLAFAFGLSLLPH